MFTFNYKAWLYFILQKVLKKALKEYADLYFRQGKLASIVRMPCLKLEDILYSGPHRQDSNLKYFSGQATTGSPQREE